MKKEKKQTLTVEEKKENETREEISHYEPTDEEEKARQKVYDRYKDMKTGRTSGDINFEDEWDEADKAYEGYIEPLSEDDWRSNLHIPIEFSLTQAMLREMIEVPSMFYTEPSNEESFHSSILMNEVIKYALQRGKYQVVKSMLDHSRLVRGTAVGKVTYRLERRKIYELSKYNEDDPDKEAYIEKQIDDFSDAYIKFIDLWFFYVDDMARNIDDARDCIEREVLNIKEFRRLYGKYPNSEYVVAGGDTTMYQYYQPPKDVTKKDVEVLHYYNKPDDNYYIVANDVAIRVKPMPNDHKQLPYFMLYGYRDPNNIYGKGLPKMIKSLVEEFNTLRNLRIDFQHMSHDKMFLVSDQLDVEEEDLIVRPHGMIPVATSNMPLQNYIMPIEYGDIKPSSSKDIEYIAEDIRRTIGVDDRVQAAQTGSTATEAAILKEVTMKAIQNMIVGAEIDGLLRAGQLFTQTIQQYYPLIKVKDITKNKNTYHQIRLKDMKLAENQDGQPQLEPNEGYSFFEAKPEYIRGQFDIAIKASPMPYVSKPMQQQKITEMLMTLTQAQLLEQIDPKKAVEQYLKIHDEQPDDWMKETMDSQAEQDLAMQENNQMLQGQPLPPTKNISPAHTQVHIQEAQKLEMASQTPPGMPPEMPPGAPATPPGAGEPSMPPPGMSGVPGEAPGGMPGVPPTSSTPPQAILDIFHQHIMGEQQMHQGGNLVPTKGGTPPSKKPIGGITAPRNVNPNKLTGGEGVGNL